MSVTLAEVRRVAFALPEVTEEPHHEMASFRVRGKIIATVPDPEHLRLMLDEHEIRAASSENPQSFHEFYWGNRLACLVVDLADVTLPKFVNCSRKRGFARLLQRSPDSSNRAHEHA